MGPLVVAGVAAADPSHLPEGMSDSKRLSPERREALAAAILDAPGVRVAILAIESVDLDAAMAKGSLNDIEAEAFAEVLRRLEATHAVVDTVGPGPTFGRRLTAMLGGDVKVEARPRADATDPFVGAASIVAKVTRDGAMRRIEDEIGHPVGSGYPSDPTTRGFLETWRDTKEGPPPHARMRWATMSRLGFGNHSILEFADKGTK